jgi:hypothetical protein
MLKVLYFVHVLYLCVTYDSYNKYLMFPFIALTDWSF